MGNASGFNLKNYYNILSNNQGLLYAYQFVAEFYGDCERFGISSGGNANDNMSYYISSADIPGVTLTTAKTPYLGTEFRSPGVKTFTHTWSCNVILMQDLKIYKNFRKWMENISSLRLDGGGQKGIPNSSVRLSILDPTSTRKEQSFVIEGIWPKSVGDIQLKYEQGGGNPVTAFPISLVYQYVYRDDGLDYSNDPLKA